MKLPLEEVKRRSDPIAARVPSLEIRLTDMRCHANGPLAASAYTVSSEIGVSAQASDSSGVRTLTTYRVTAVPSVDDSPELAGDDAFDPASTGWSIDAVFQTTWKPQPGTDLPEFEPLDLQCFSALYAGVVVHPYARELVQSTIARVGYPPFTLDLLFSPVNGLDDDVIELGEIPDMGDGMLDAGMD